MVELRIFKGQQIDAEFVERVVAFDRKNMQPVLEQAGIEFPEEKRRRGFQNNPTLIVALAGSAIAGYLEYSRSWRNPDYIYVGSIQIDAPYRHTSLMLRLLESFHALVATEEFIGFETNVQKSNRLAVGLYQKIGFKLEHNPDNDASWLARAGRELLTDSPIIPLIAKWRAQRQSRRWP